MSKNTALVMLVKDDSKSFEGTDVVELPTVTLEVPSGFNAAASAVTKLVERRPGLSPLLPAPSTITVLCTGNTDLEQLKWDLLELIDGYEPRSRRSVGLMRKGDGSAESNLNWQSDRDTLEDIE